LASGNALFRLELYDVSLYYLALEAEGQSAMVNIKDRELLRRIKEIDKLNERYKGKIKELLNTLYPEKLDVV
jgi:hypothetical protein